MLEYFAECALREWMSMMKQPRTRLSVRDRVLDEVRTVQQELFESADPARAKRRRLLGAVDAIADRFGEHAVFRAGEGAVSRAGLSLQRKRGERQGPHGGDER